MNLPYHRLVSNVYALVQIYYHNKCPNFYLTLSVFESSSQGQTDQVSGHKKPG